MKHFFIYSLILLSSELFARQIDEATFSYWNKPDSKIYFSVPESIDENTKIIFIMHGASRTAEKYINDWLPLVQNRNVVLIAPKFSKESFPSRIDKISMGLPSKQPEILPSQAAFILFVIF